MIVERLTAPSLASREISRSIVTPSTSFPDAPVNCRVLHLAPGAQTAPHNHHDSEIWMKSQRVRNSAALATMLAPGDWT